MLTDLIEVCSVPNLRQDIEEHPIDRENFAEYVKILEINSPVLLDFLSNNERIQEIIAEDDPEAARLRQQLIMLMCEHSPIMPGVYPPFTAESPAFAVHLNRICVTNHITSGHILGQCLQDYKDLLLDSKWRLAIGTSYGFVSFCHLYLNSRDIHVDLQTLLFILSIASQFIECIHGAIKLLSLRLYELILGHGPPQLILASNVHKVVIKSCLDNAQKLLPDDCLLLLWRSVAQALILDEKGLLQDLHWNELDDSLLLLFQRIKLEGKRKVRAQLRGVLADIIRKCFETKGALSFRNDGDCIETQQEITRMQIKNVKLFRWITDLKELFIFECLSVSNGTESTKETLSFITDNYLMTMCGLPGDIIGPTLNDLAMRITPLLLEISTLYREDRKVNELIASFLRMILVHLDQISPEPTTKSVHHLALHKLVTVHFPSAGLLSPTSEARSE